MKGMHSFSIISHLKKMTFNVEFFNAQILKYKKQYIGFLMEEVALAERTQTLVKVSGE